MELGAAVRDAAIRETKEECGLDVELVEDTPMDAYDILKLDEDGVFGTITCCSSFSFSQKMEP